MFLFCLLPCDDVSQSDNDNDDTSRVDGGLILFVITSRICNLKNNKSKKNVRKTKRQFVFY